MQLPSSRAPARDSAADPDQVRLADRLVQHARHLLSAGNPVDILARTCREARFVTGGCAAFGVYTHPGQTWDRGLHLRCSDPESAPPPRVISALFAVHRKVAMARGPAVVTREELPVAMASLTTAADAPAAQVLAVPMRSRTGRFMGEIVVAIPHEHPLPDEAVSVVTELAHLASAALESSQRVAFARRDQERLNLLAEASDEALWDWNTETGEFWWGGAVQKLLGGENVVVQNRLDWKFQRIHPDDRERVRRSFDAALTSRKESAWIEEYRVERVDGSTGVVEDRGYFLRETEGRAYRVVGALRDITPLKDLLVREKQARAQAEAASRAKDDFLAMLGHELRNPMAPILAAADVLRQRGLPGIERERTIIERQTRQLVRLVDDLLDVSRVATGKIELHKQRIGLSQVVAEAVEMARTAIEERGHTLTVRVPDALSIVADPGRFAQVLCNLLTNAARYTEPGGRIALEADHTDNEVVLHVTDDGIGIEPAMLPRVFDMFVQERQPLDRARGGLGLGLSIVRSLVTLHDGTVDAHSEGRGRGSRFTIRLPLRPSVPVAVPSDPGLDARPPATASALRILIVDDNEDAADMLTVYLRHMGHATAKAHDGATALRAVNEFRPDVVLLDVGLPVMNGYDVARALRTADDGGWLCLIAVTGYGQASDRQRALDAGFDAHVVKPVSMAELHGLITELASAAGRIPAA